MVTDEYSAGVVIFRKRGGKRHMLFLIRDGKKRWFDTPKGHIEAGESAEQAAIRETREESGLTVKLNPFFRHETLYFFNKGKERIRKHVSFFIGEVDGPKRVTVSAEHVGYKWLSYGDAMESVAFENQRELLAHVEGYMQRVETMDKLNRRYRGLPSANRKWGLSRRLVPGEGPLDAGVMLIGQAPGRFEDETRRPFVGTSGKLLDHLLRLAGLRRNKVYVTSVVQFFPPKNRMPKPEEVSACRKFLLEQIDIIKPRVIVLLGTLAARETVGVGTVMKNHGRRFRSGGITYFVTIHPAAAVRLKRNVPIAENDFRKLGKLLKEGSLAR